jgi:hypothetical protein
MGHLAAETPVDQFLGSVREVFATNRDLDWRRIGALLVGSALVLVASSVTLARWKARRRATASIQTVTSAARLAPPDLAYLQRIADAAGLPILDVMTKPPAFERATALALTAEAPPLRPVAGSPYERVRHLRTVLGFSPLPAHRWLLSTRELTPGDPVALAGVTGAVAEVNEASFAVDFSAGLSFAVGASAALAIVRTEDSLYLARVRVLGTEPIATLAEGRRAFFGHDEKPERQQQREHVRVSVAGEVTLRLVEPERAAMPEPGSVAPIAGALVDVSAGGLSLEVPLSSAGPFRRGTKVGCSFALGSGPPFHLTAVILSQAEGEAHARARHLRMSFTSLSDAERDRLAAAVAKRQGHPPPDL